MSPEKKHFADYHAHPYYSLDAEGTVDNYCEQALSVGLSEIGFAPHLELDSYRKALDDKVRIGNEIVSMRSGWLCTFIQDVSSAREKYPIQIRAGVEVGYDESIEDELRETLERYPFDFCLGAIHCLDHVAITDRREYELYYRNRRPEDVVRNYFSALRKAIRSGLFDCIAHIDIYKKYGFNYYGGPIREFEKDHIEGVLKDLVEYGILLEINTAGLRTIGHPYPSERTLRLAREMGVTKVTIGSDCHKVTQLGFGIEEATGLAHSLGFTNCGFKNRKTYGIDYTVE